MGLTVLSSGAAPQTLQALPSHGESLFFLAHELGVRVLKRKRLRNQVEELEQRYFEYLHLLASDTQVRPGSLNRGSPGRVPQASSRGPLPLPLRAWGGQIGPQTPPQFPHLTLLIARG